MKRIRTINTPDRIRTFDNIRILTNDPSLTAWGWVIVDTKGNVIKAGCIKTESEHKKRRIRKGDDTIRRVSEINEQLLKLVYENNVQILLSELPHGSQNAQAAVMIGIVTAIVQTISDIKGFPIEWYSEQDAKKHLLNKRSATKKEVIDAIGKLYSIPWNNVKYKDEAIADAMAIYHVAKNQSSLLKMNI